MDDLTILGLLGYFAAGFIAVFTIKTFAALCLGLFMGFWVGILPGVGGPATLALLIPFTFTMEPFPAFALLLGMISVTSTAGDMTAILFGIPGESTNAATLVDGLPMAKSGEAGRALGAVLSASLFGCIIGAFFLALGIVLVRPLVLSVGYAEFFMLSLAGITFLASLSTGAVIKGLLSGALGLLLSLVGLSQVTGIERFTFGSLFFWDGIGFIPVILGLFAIPELVDMASGKSRLNQTDKKISNAFQGVRDSIEHFGLIFRCSALATYIGLIPGMGASIAQWVAYGHAAQTAKERDKIGKGAVEGVIGPGAANNATMSGSLIPTIGFGVPGSPQMAILLGAFIIQGLVPGPSMLTPEQNGGHLTLTFSLVWMIIISNIIVVLVSFIFLNHIAKVAYLDVNILIPFILLLIFIGAFANANNLLDLWVCLGFGVLGVCMERLGWPRPPLILGLVLGALIENNLFLTLQAYGMSWMTAPGVVVIFCLIISSLAWPFFVKVRSNRLTKKSGGLTKPGQSIPLQFIPEEFKSNRQGDLILIVCLLIVFVYGLLESSNWPLSAKLMPFATCLFGLSLLAIKTSTTIFALWKDDIVVAEKSRSLPEVILKPSLFILSQFIALALIVYLFGFVYSIGLFLFVNLRIFAKFNWIYSIGVALVSSFIAWYGFQEILGLPFPDGALISIFEPWINLSLR